MLQSMRLQKVGHNLVMNNNILFSTGNTEDQSGNCLAQGYTNMCLYLSALLETSNEFTLFLSDF